MIQLSISLGECPLGVFAYDERGEMIASATFPHDAREISGKLSLIRKGGPTEEHLELTRRLLEEGHEEFVLESDELASELREKFERASFRVEVPNLANLKLRESLPEIAEKLGFENVKKLLRDVNILITREMMREEVSERDKIVIESINTLDELDKTTNTLYERIKEWYGIHFPELERYISDHLKYLELISELGRRDNFTKEKLVGMDVPEGTAKDIQKEAEKSIGADLDELDIEAIQASVGKILSLQEAREKISDYLDGLMEQVAPNIKTLVGRLLGARLISLAGGLEDLAKMPSSTIQVLGAEKALFRSLQKGTKPPKHGVIFQHPEIRGSPKSIRGKIARALAGKLAIAARVDAMSGRYVGDELKEEVEGRIESIKREEG